MFFQKHDDDEYGYKMWLSEDEVTQLLDAAHSSKCRLAFQLGVRCGLRSDEIVRIAPKAVKQTEAGWMLRVDSAKTDGVRQTPAPEVVAGMIQAYGESGGATDPVIDVTTRTIRNWVKRAGETLANETGDEMWAHLSPHDLRRTWATALKAEDVESLIVCDWGGWSNLETFLEHYRGAFSPDAQRQQREKVAWL